MEIREMSEIVAACSYKRGWWISVREDDGGRPFIQLRVSEKAEASTCSQTGKRVGWSSGKHYLSQHMCRQEVVGVVFAAIKAAEEHEMREWFRYRGAAIFNAHLCPDRLAEFARKLENFEFRENAMTMEEKASA